MINDILRVMNDVNTLVKCFIMVRDFREVYQNVPVQLCLFRNRSYDPRTYNVPEIGEVAALIVGDFDGSEDGRDIVVRERDGNLQRIHETHAKYLPLQYPLLFPFGEDQYQENIELNSLTTSTSVNKRRRVSLREFIAFRLQERAVENSILFYGRLLFQQFIIDVYSMLESQRLSWLRSNQGSIRSGFLAGIEEAVIHGDIEASSLGLELFCLHHSRVVRGICSIVVRMLWLYAKNIAILIFF